LLLLQPLLIAGVWFDKIIGYDYRKEFMNTAFSKYWIIFICVFLAGATVAVYWRVGSYEFISLDDPDYVSSNKQVQAGLSCKSIAWAFTTGHSANWHPLTWLSLMLDYQIFGDKPGAFHITNLMLHIANTLLLFVVLKWMTALPWHSGFVAALFALHPLHVESVAWVTERKDVLSTLFWMLTMLCYVWYVKRRGIGRYLLTLVLFMLGLMAKPMLVSLPLILLLLDYWPLGRLIQNPKLKDVRPLIVEKIPFFVMAAASCIVTFVVQKTWGAVLSLEHLSLGFRIANALVSYVRYIWKMIWPISLSVFYPAFGKLPLLQAFGSAFLIIGVSLMILRLSRYRWLAVGWLWYLITLVPVIGLVQVGRQSIADRYTYISLIGLFIIIAWGADGLMAKWRRREIIAAVSASVMALVLAICTWVQVGYWRDSFTLFNRAMAVTGENRVALFCLGNAFLEKKETDKAIHNYREMLRFGDDLYAHYGLGQAFFLKGRLDESIYHYEQAVRLKNDYLDVHTWLANALLKKGQTDKAIEHFQEALRLSPSNAEAHNGLALALAKKGQIDQAIGYYNKALEIESGSYEIHNNLGNALLKKGQVEDAILHYRRAIELSKNQRPKEGLLPEFGDAHYNLANALRMQRQFSEAAGYYDEALKIDPNNADAWYNLGMTLADLNKYGDAVDCYKTTLKLKPDFVKVRYNLGMALFEQGKLDEAIEQFRQVLHAYPEDAEMHCNLGVLLDKKGLFDQAVEEFRTALRLDPNLTRADEQLKAALGEKGG
jgi:tetratricopeptide (TPR) repeat protein